MAISHVIMRKCRLNCSIPLLCWKKKFIYIHSFGQLSSIIISQLITLSNTHSRSTGFCCHCHGCGLDGLQQSYITAFVVCFVEYIFFISISLILAVCRICRGLFGVFIRKFYALFFILIERKVLNTTLILCANNNNNNKKITQIICLRFFFVMLFWFLYILGVSTPANCT